MTWAWCVIIELYRFGDKHDTKAFRNAMMDVALQKAIQSTPRVYLFPARESQKDVYEQLPVSSSLFKLFVDISVYELNADNNEDSLQRILMLPQEALALLYCRSSTLARKLNCQLCKSEQLCENDHASMPLYADFRFDFCRYHEHDTGQEKEACARKCKIMQDEHNILMLEQ